MPRKIKRDDENHYTLKQNDTILNYLWQDEIKYPVDSELLNNCIPMIKFEDDLMNSEIQNANHIKNIFHPCHIKGENEHLLSRIRMDQTDAEKNRGREAIPEQKNKMREKKEVEKVLGRDTPEEEVDQILETLKNVCPMCQKDFDDEKQMQRHYKKVHKRPYTCDKCNKGYYSMVALREHERSHKDDAFLECANCHQRFKRKLGLRLHQLRSHSNLEAIFACDYCDKRFKLKNDLCHHIKRAHTSLICICKYCGKSVRNIEDHEWKHMKTEKKLSFQYPCHLCPKKFRNNNNLENHLLQHQGGFKCNVCEESFELPASLEKHKDMKHKPSLMCPICRRVFNSRSNFYTHVLTHDRVRPYKCDVCNEYFTQRSSLLRHRRNHPGPLPPLNTTTKIAEIAKKILEKA